jgi:uncharacterized protein YjiS (DUF1127 family)
MQDNFRDIHASDHLDTSISLLLELPDELLLEVTRALEGDNVALAAMMRSCRHLKAMSEGLLYKDITIQRGDDDKSAYLVRTLLEKPAHAVQVRKINLELTMRYMDQVGVSSPLLKTVSVMSQLRCAAILMSHFEQFDNRHLDAWAGQVVSGVTMNIVAMLLTLMPFAKDLCVRLYELEGFEYHMFAPSTRLFDINDADLFNVELRPLFVPFLKNVKRLSLLGLGIDLLVLPFEFVEALEIDLVAECIQTPAQGPPESDFQNIVRDTDLTLSTLPHLQTLIVQSDWSELLPHQHIHPTLRMLFAEVDAPQLAHLEFYVTRSSRRADTKLLDFGHTAAHIGSLIDKLESVRFDYTDGPNCNPRAWLGDCSPASTLAMFSKVRKLIVLQRVIISSNYSRSFSYERDLPSFLPPPLPTARIAHDRVSDQVGSALARMSPGQQDMWACRTPQRGYSLLQAFLRWFSCCIPKQVC